MKSLDLYISGKRVDLFNDEQITLTIQQQNVKDISKVFSDFSQTFTLPASKQNNKIFSHYYRTDLVSGYFDARVKVDAKIDLAGVLFRSGVVQLESVSMKDGKAQHYAVTFYGKTTQLIDIFGNDKLEDLDLSAYRHKYNLGVIRDSVKFNNLKSGNVSYPLITYSRNWRFGSNDSDDIQFDAAFPLRSIKFYELKPALRVKRIIEAIAAKYGIAFTGSFLSESQLNELYLLCHNKVGQIFTNNPQDIGEKVDFISVNSGATWDWSLSEDEIYPTAQPRAAMNGEITIQSGTKFQVTMMMNGELFRTASGTGTGSPLQISFGQYDFDGTETLEFYVKTTDLSSKNFTFDFEAVDFYSMGGTPLITALGSSNQLYELYLDMESAMPDMTITSFITSLIKMFNLTITATSNTSFSLQRLDDWYSSGNTISAEKTISTQSVTLKRPPLFKKISFKYQEAGSILAQNYFETNNIGYADTEAEFDFEGSDFQIQVDFEPLMFERMINEVNDFETDLCVGKMIDRELSPYIGKPVLLYHSGLATLGSGQTFAFGGDAASTNITQYHVFGQSTTLDGIGTYSSLNFGASIDPFVKSPLFNSLYASSWQNYITGFYDVKRRQVTCSGNLTFRQAINLEPNTRLIWRNDEYLINSASLNLMTGAVTFDLINNV